MEECGDDASRVVPPVRARELLEDPDEAAAVEAEGWGLRRRGPCEGTEVPWPLFTDGPRIGPPVGVGLALDCSGGRRR